MNKLTVVIIVLLSILAPAQTLASTFAFQNSPSLVENNDSNEENTLDTEFIVEAPGFDKQLNMLVLNPEISRFDIKLTDNTGRKVLFYSTSASPEGIVEVDLTDFEGGFYQLTLSVGEKESLHTIVLP